MAKPLDTSQIAHSVRLLRGVNVLLDADLAELYKVETRALLQAVRRNKDRFPSDFMFRLTDQEFRDLRSQIVISSWGGRRVSPYAFTEQGVAMLSSVLQSPRAIAVNIEVMRTFVRLRQAITMSQDLSHQLAQLEARVDKNDEAITAILDAIRQLMSPPAPRKPPIGFVR